MSSQPVSRRGSLLHFALCRRHVHPATSKSAPFKEHTENCRSYRDNRRRYLTRSRNKSSRIILCAKKCVCAVPRLARMDTFASGVSTPMSVARAQTARVPCTLWSNFQVRKKKTQRQGRLVVHMPSAIYHELSRAQPKLGGKCVSVGVDGAGCCVERKNEISRP